MILKIDGKINPYYIQTVCMLFFPGESFSPDEKEEDGKPSLLLSVKETDVGVDANCTLSAYGKKRSASKSLLFADYTSKEACAKVAAGSVVLDAGKRVCSFSPPWGILTGVRPAKLVTQMISDGMDYPSIRKKLTKDFFVSPKKASLAINVSRSEQKILKKIPQNTCSLYISIPFCPSRCNYCSFVSYSTRKLFSLIPDYLVCLCEDIKKTCGLIPG